MKRLFFSYFFILFLFLPFISCDFVQGLDDLNTENAVTTPDGTNEESLVCGECHDYPLMNTVSQPNEPYHVECSWCHGNIFSDNTSFVDFDLHNNGMIDIVDQENLQCMACHDDDYLGYSTDYTMYLTDHNTATCSSCHHYWDSCTDCHYHRFSYPIDMNYDHQYSSCEHCHIYLHDPIGWNSILPRDMQ